MTSSEYESGFRNSMDDLTKETERELALDAFEAGQKAIEIVWKTILAAYKKSDQFALKGEVDYFYAQVHSEFDDRENGSVTTPKTMSILLVRTPEDEIQSPLEIYLHIPLSARAFDAYKEGDQDTFEEELGKKPEAIYVQEIYDHPSGPHSRYMEISAAGIIEYPAISSESREEQITEFAFFLEQLQDIDSLRLGEPEVEAMQFYTPGPSVDINTVNTLRANIASMKVKKQKLLEHQDISDQIS